MLFVVSPFIVYVSMNLRAYLVHGYLIDGKLEILRHIPLLKTYTNWLYLEELSEIVNEENVLRLEAESVWKVCGKCVESVWKVCGKCVGSVLEVRFLSLKVNGFSILVGDTQLFTRLLSVPTPICHT